MKKSLTTFALLLCFSGLTFAQKTWTGSTSTAWNIAGNWNPVGIPTASDNVTIPSGTTHSPTVSGSTGGVCNNLTVNSGATLSITGTSGSSTVLTVSGTATLNGALSIGGHFLGNTGKLIAGNVVWNSTSSINAYLGGRMEVSGNYTFASGSSINLGWCWLTFTGGSNSNIYNHSASSSFSSVTLSKTGSAIVYVNSSSSATITIDGALNIGAGSVFIGQPNITTILKGNLINSGNIYLNSGTLSLEKSSGTQDIQINTNDYFNSVRINTGGTVTISTSYFMQLKGSMNIQAGVLDPQNNTIALFGDWTNTVGTGGFEQGIGRVIFNGGNYHQYCSNETFFTLEVHKAVGGALRMNGTNVTCTKYDWTAGAIDVLNNGTFTVSNQLLDNGIAGNFYLNAGCTINLTNLTGNVDLKGNLYIYGGIFNVYGGINPSWWPAGGNASITMSGGVLDFVDQSIVVKTDLTYTFTQNITGGTIRTSKDFSNGRSNFTPAGGKVEQYGSANSLLTMTAGNLHEYSVNKNSGSQVTLNTNATVNGSLTIGGGTLATSNKTLNLLSHLDINAAGTLHLGAGSQTIFANGKYLYVSGNGTLKSEGTQSQNAIVTSSSGFYFIQVYNNGTIAAKHTTFRKMNNLYLFDGSIVDPANSFYKCTFTDNSPAYANMLIFANAQEILIRDAHFPLLNSDYTISKPNNSGKVTFKDATGAYAGPAYESDPYNRIDWVESQPGLWTGIASNDWNDPENWDDLALPNSSASVVIPASVPNMPVLNSETAILVNDMTVLGTLTIGEANLITNFNCTISGSLVISSDVTEQGYLQVLGDLNFESGSAASLTSTSDISVKKNLVFNFGSNVQFLNGRLLLNGAFISQVINHSENTFIEMLVVDKSDSFYARFSDASTQHLNVNYLDLWDGHFLTSGDKHFVLNKNLNNMGGHISCTEGTFKLDGITQTLKLLPDDYFHHLVFSQTGTASLNTVNTSVLNVNGDLHINSGMFDATGLTIKLGGNWVNIAEPAAFTETGSRVIFNGGDYHQYLWHDEIFDTLEVDKPLGGALRMNNGPTIVCNVYDWTAGAIDALNGAVFTAYDLADEGIYGNYYVNPDCEINLYKPGEYQTLDLIGNFNIWGGNFNVFGHGDSQWGRNGNCTLNMSGGVLNFENVDIWIDSQSPYSFTGNINGGSIRTSGDFAISSDGNFNPTGGNVEIYGTNNGGIYAYGGSFYDLIINLDYGWSYCYDAQVTNDLLIQGGRFVISIGNTLECWNSIEISSWATLDMHCLATLKMKDMSSIVVHEYGEVLFDCDGGIDNATISGITPNDYYSINATANSYITVRNTSFNQLMGQGFYVAPGATINPEKAFSSCMFGPGKPGSNALLSIDNNQNIILRNVVFPDNSSGVLHNVSKTVDAGSLTFKDATGDFAGPGFENDPFNRINWGISQPGLWTGISSNNWYNSTNWDDLQVPTGSTAVTIPASCPYMPWISQQNVTCHSIDIQGTLDIGEGTLEIQEDVQVSGKLRMWSSAGVLLVHGNIFWLSGSTTSMHTNAMMNIKGNWSFEAGSDVQLNNGIVSFTGLANSRILVHSPTSYFNDLDLAKSPGAQVEFDAFSTAALNASLLGVTSSSKFISNSSQDIVVRSNFYTLGETAINQGTLKFSGNNQLWMPNLNTYVNNLTFNQSGTVSVITDYTDVLDIRGAVTINSGVFEAGNCTINVGSHWSNNVGPAAFNEVNSRVVFNGNNMQTCGNEEFYILEIDKDNFFLSIQNESVVSCLVYDWTNGRLYTHEDATFNAYDLADDGIYGWFSTGSSGTINLYQDENQSVNIMGGLQINGGTLNIYGGNDQCSMGFTESSVLNMTSGVLDIKDQGIYIIDNYPFVFSGNISGGTIRSSRGFTAQSPGFVPDGGTVEVYGEDIGFLFAQDGASFYNLRINKTYSYYNTWDHIQLLSSLIRNDFMFQSGSVSLGYDTELECWGNVTISDGAVFRISCADLLMKHNKALLIEEGGLIKCSGQENRYSKITGVTTADYYSLNVEGVLESNYAQISQMNEQGIYVSPSGKLHAYYADIVEGKPGPNSLITINSNELNILNYVNFPQNTWGSQHNVRKINDAGQVFMLDATGPFSGQAFEDDPYDRVHWMPGSYTSQPQTIESGISICEDAFYILTVADLVVESGGSADLIAASKIKILPGTHIMSGGYMHAWITETYEFCEQQQSMLASVSPDDEEENSFLSAMRFASNDDQYHYLNMYPNPTSGIVNIELNGLNPDEKIILQVYGITGDLREQLYYSGAQRLSLDLSGWNPGVYLIRILDGNKSFTGKIIKQ
ncbi:MAG: T9SS type A sorting domain-containing protein [Bacteroidales bacterium]|nr:T9SS type A sorting domain-containing protein [Bacteroidales bacterium]